MRSALFVVAALLSITAAADPHPFDVHDLVMMDRVSDPQISPDGKRIAYQLRETDYEANKGVNSVWIGGLGKNAKATKVTNPGFTSVTSPRWAADGKSVYALAKFKGEDATQVWRLSVDGDAINTHRVTNVPLDIGSFRLSPDGKQILLAIDVFTDCDDLACTKKRLDEKSKVLASGRLYDKLFIRHWDTWADGTRSQLFIADLPSDGKPISDARLLTKGIDGDVPSKPFGDDNEYAFSPDGHTVYFDVRIAGKTEPWSTNFDIYSVPADGSAAPKNLTAANLAWDSAPLPSADGKTLYYVAMKRPTFEADRFGIMALDLASGQAHEIDPKWDRSAGALQLSKDGRTLFTTTDDNGDHALFPIDIGSGKATGLVGAGQVEGFSVRGNDIVFSRSTLKTPADLFRTGVSGGK